MNEYTTQKLKLAERFRYAMNRCRGIHIESDLRPYLRSVGEIRGISYRDLDDADLTRLAGRLAHRALQGEPLEDLLPEMFALAAAGALRTLGLDVFDEQLVAAVAMHQGKLVQMQTGEGKTLAAAFTASLNALTRSGVHVLTANEYLASRDAEWMGPIYRLLGLRAAHVADGMTDDEKRSAYAADITYLTAKQSGFDFLHDGLRFSSAHRVQRPFAVCIVDEADFILIDEARIPLVIAKETEPGEIDPVRIDAVAERLHAAEHFTVDRTGRLCALTLEGQEQVAQMLGCGGMHEANSLPFYAAVNVALHARHLLSRDIDYIVRDGRIELVDELTGRIAERRKWPYGIQTALEVKEGLMPERQGTVCGSITVQHFIEQYPKVAAMTATAVSAAEELSTFYGLGTVVIPPHRPNRRVRLEDRVFSSRDAKTAALLAEIEAIHRTGRPILVGTGSVRESVELSGLLDAAGIGHAVLNAENDAEEAVVIAGAGKAGAVTISTNMAGRGTDIRLGGLEGEEREYIESLGGLYVIGTNRHESVRIDDQLLGRAGRQGDPGSGRFFVSLEDDLVTRYAITDFIPAEYSGSGSREPIADRMVAKEIGRAQEIIGEQHFQMRRTLRRYTQIVEKQRFAVSRLRLDALDHGLFPESLLDLCGSSDDAELLGLLFADSLDSFWSGHLAWVDTVREGIHLRRLGKEDPLLAFLKDVTFAFDDGLEQAMAETASSLRDALENPGGREELRKRLTGPSSTWTYMINDNPFPSFRLSFLGLDSGSGAAGAMAAAAAAPFILLYSLLRGVNRFMVQKRKARDRHRQDT